MSRAIVHGAIDPDGVIFLFFAIGEYQVESFIAHAGNEGLVGFGGQGEFLYFFPCLIKILLAAHEVGQVSPEVETAYLEGQVFSVSFRGFQVGKVNSGFVEPAGIEIIFCLEIVFPGSVVMDTVNFIHDALESGKLCDFFFVLSRSGVVHHGEGRAAEAKPGGIEFLFCVKLPDTAQNLGAGGSHLVQIIEGSGAFQKIHGNLSQGIQAQPFDTGKAASIFSLQTGEVKVINHEKHSFHVFFYNLIGNLIQKIGRIHAGAGEEDAFYTFIQDVKRKFIIFGHTGKPHGFGKISRGVVPVGRFFHILELHFFIQQFKFRLEKFLHQGEEGVCKGLPVQIKGKSAFFLPGKDSGCVCARADKECFVQRKAVKKGKNRQGFPGVLIQIAEYFFIDCAEEFRFFLLIYDTCTVMVMKLQVFDPFCYGEGFLILQFVVGDGVVQMHHFPAGAAGGIGISSIEKIAFCVFFQEEVELRCSFNIGRSDDQPEVGADLMRNSLLVAEYGGNHLVFGRQEKVGHCVPPGGSHSRAGTGPGDVLCHEGNEQGNFIFFKIVVEDLF